MVLAVRAAGAPRAHEHARPAEGRQAGPQGQGCTAARGRRRQASVCRRKERAACAPCAHPYPRTCPFEQPAQPARPAGDYPTVQAFIAIGANLGDAEASVKAAMADIGALQRTVVTARSSLYRSEPVDAEGPDFINAVVAVRTGLDAEQLLVALQRLETLAGRERPFPNAPRTLDLDLLMHGNSVIDTPTLTLPHPRMRERAFVLKPLAEIAPDKVPRAALARVTGQVVKRIL